MTAAGDELRLVAGRYRLLRKLGQGAGGVTWEARDDTDGGLVALKELTVRGADDWKRIELAEREARVAMTLEHPHIPRYLAAFTEEGPEGPALYLVRELVVGESLEELVRGSVPLSEAEIDGLIRQMLDVLGYLQPLVPPVFHRDIKPANILRDRESPGRFYLVDFGAVAAASAGASTGTTVVGTFGYMAPEQLRGASGPSTDLFGLGMTLIHVLSRRDPASLPTVGLKVDLTGCLPAGPRRRWLESLVEPDSRLRPVDARAALRSLDAPPGAALGRAPWIGAGLVAALAIGAAITLGARRPAPRPGPTDGAATGGPTPTPTQRAAARPTDELNLAVFCKPGEVAVRLELHWPAPESAASCERLMRATEGERRSPQLRAACGQRHPMGRVPEAVASVHVASCTERAAPATGVMLDTVACCVLDDAQ